MDVFLDHEPFAVQATTLGQIIAQARQHVEPGGRLIVEVRLDGRVLDEDELGRLADQLPHAEELQLVTARPTDLAAQIAGEISAALQQIRPTQRQIATLLGADDPAAALEQVSAVLSVWQQAREALQSLLQILQIAPQDIQVEGRPALQIITTLADRLTEIRRQLTAGDWVALADSFAYDLDDAADQWSALFDELLRRLRD